jgi:ubiquinone/menaquinone biosynthesis C-methylase UbiE
VFKVFYDFYAQSARRSERTRQAFVIKFLKSLPAGTKLLDVGAGTQRYKKYASHLNYVSQDFCQYDGKGDGGNQSGEWDTSEINIRSDITQIPVPDGSFDSVICTDVLEHVPDAPAALREICRVVRPGGSILVTVPMQCDSHQTPYFFSGGYSKYFFAEHLAGHTVSIQYEAEYFETIDQKLFLGFVNLTRLAKAKPQYVPALVIYTVLGIPMLLLLRSLPRFAGDLGNNGLLVEVKKASI